MTDRFKTRLRARKGLSLFAEDCSGSTAIEYALIAAGISTAILVSVTDVGSAVVGLFSTVAGIF